MISRLPNWPDLLVRSVESRRDQVFERSRTDCMRTVADIIRDFTGTDLMGDEWRNAYSSDKDALRIIRSHGGDLMQLFKGQAEKHGAAEVDPRLANRGDLAFIRIDEFHQGAALFYGTGVISPGRTGFISLPRSSVLRAWRI